MRGVIPVELKLKI